MVGSEKKQYDKKENGKRKFEERKRKLSYSESPQLDPGPD